MQEIRSHGGSVKAARSPLHLYGSFRQLKCRPTPVAFSHKTSTYRLSPSAKPARVPDAPEELRTTAERVLHQIMARQKNMPCSHATVWSNELGNPSPDMLFSCANSTRRASKDESVYTMLPDSILEQLQRSHREGSSPFALEFSDEHHKTVLVLPASSRSGRGGFVCCYHREPVTYNDADLEMMLVLADTVVHTMHVLNHCDELQRKVRLDEQQRIARNLHDTIIQDAASAVLQLENARLSLSRTKTSSKEAHAESSDAHRHVLLASGLTRRVMDRLRKTMWNLHESSKQEASREEGGNTLTPRAIAMAREILGTLPKETRASFSVQGDEVCVAPSVSNELLYILSEALNNVVKHAKASRVDVSITFGDSQISVVVKDNGCGFDKKIVPNKTGGGGFGMTSMRERVEAIQAKLIVASSPGKGTKIRITVPL